MRNRALAGILVAMVVGLTPALFGRGAASAHEPHPGLNLYISAIGVANCDTKSDNGSCDLAPGSTFVIGVYLDPLPSDLPNYAGFDVSLRHSGVTPNQDANTDVWPDCGFPATSNETVQGSDTIVFACAINVPPAGPSTYSGLIGTNSFVCASSGSVTLVHGIGNTDLFEENIQGHAEAPNTSEELTINCVQGGVEPPPVTPAPGVDRTSEPPRTPLPPTEAARATGTAQSQATATAQAVATAGTRTPGPGTTAGDGGDDGGLDTWVIVLIVAGGVAAAAAAGGAGWWYLQRRGVAGGGPPPAA